MSLITNFVVGSARRPGATEVQQHLIRGDANCSPFRPRTEKRTLRFHLPFTPGIIPKNRNELVESITRAVAGEMISQEADDQAAHLAHFTAAGYTTVAGAMSDN